MGVRDRLRKATEALLGVSAYEPAKGFGPELDDPSVKAAREAIGGNIQPLPSTRLRWYLEDLEAAQIAADTGFLRMAAQLSRAMQRDGVLRGLLDARAAALLRSPIRLYGNTEVADVLRARNGSRSVFSEMFPPSELRQMSKDGVNLGIAVAEMVPVKGRDFPVMVRLEPEFLQYRWSENRWYFNGLAGSMPITPGDGRWILHVPGGRLTPWMGGLYPALGESFINKSHAKLYRSNYCAKLANPARLAYAPQGATEAQRMGFFKRILAWGVNTVLELPPGWEAKLLESNGRGWEVFQRQIDTSDKEYAIAVAGQEVTTSGGTGFSNVKVPDAIRVDLVQSDADALAYTVNTQGLPAFIVQRWGEAALEMPTIVEWDVARSDDKERESRMLSQVGAAITALDAALAPHGKATDVNELTVRFGVPTRDEAVAVLAGDARDGGASGNTEGSSNSPAAAPREVTDGDDVDMGAE